MDNDITEQFPKTNVLFLRQSKHILNNCHGLQYCTLKIAINNKNIFIKKGTEKLLASTEDIWSDDYTIWENLFII